MSTALVTGASGGIGEEIAKELASKGFDLILVARRAEQLNVLATLLESKHAIKARSIALDLSIDGAGQKLFQLLEGNDVDVLVNNAGIGLFGGFIHDDPDRLNQLVMLNVVALTDLTRALLPQMVARGSGRVLNVASVAGFMPGPLMAAYFASKAYVLSLGVALSAELAGTGVTVTTLCPGAIRTGFQKGAAMEDSKLVKGKKLMSAEDCARYGVRAMLRGTSVAVPGVANKLVTLTPRFLPRKFLAKMVQQNQSLST